MSSVAHPLWITPLERKSLPLQKTAICLKTAEVIELIIPEVEEKKQPEPSCVSASDIDLQALEVNPLKAVLDPYLYILLSLGPCPQLVKIRFIDADADLHESGIWPLISGRNPEFYQFKLRIRSRGRAQR